MKMESSHWLITESTPNTWLFLLWRLFFRICITKIDFNRCKSISKDFAFEVCIWVICQKALKRYPMVLHLEFAIWPTWQMREQTWQKCQAVDDFANPIARAKSRARKARAPGYLLFLSFAKSKCQIPWRWPIFILCILLWEFANSSKWQVNLPKPLEML